MNDVRKEAGGDPTAAGLGCFLRVFQQDQENINV